MNTTLTIDLPEVALFDTQELTLKVAAYIKKLALRKSSTKTVAKKEEEEIDLYTCFKGDWSADIPTDEYCKMLRTEALAQMKEVETW